MLTGHVKTDLEVVRLLVGDLKARGVTLAGARAAARLLVRAAKAAAPVKSGALRKAQGFRAKKGTKGRTVSYAVQGARAKLAYAVTRPGRRTPQKAVPALYDHLVELGTRPHAVGKGSRLFRADGKRVKGAGTRAGGRHPGAKPNPYHARSWAAVKGGAGEAALAAMSREIGKLLARERAALMNRMAGLK